MAEVNNDLSVVNARLDAAIEKIREHDAEHAELLADFVDAVHRPFCHMLIRMASESTDVFVAYNAFIGLQTNMLSELLASTTPPDLGQRVQVAKHLLAETMTHMVTSLEATLRRPPVVAGTA